MDDDDDNKDELRTSKTALLFDFLPFPGSISDQRLLQTILHVDTVASVIGATADYYGTTRNAALRVYPRMQA